MRVEPMLRHGWWSVRARFRIALLAVVVHAVGVPLVFSQYGAAALADWEMTPQDRAEVARPLGGSYADWLDATWAGGDLAGLLAVLGIVLAVGGVAAERRHGTADLTLSLPVPRSRWLIARGGLVLALLLALSTVSAVIVAVGGLIAGVAPPAADIALTIVLAGIGPAYAVALAIAATTFTRDAIGAALVALAVFYALDRVDALAEWQPGGVLGAGALDGGPPWRAVLVAALLTGFFLFIAIRRFDRIDL